MEHACIRALEPYLEAGEASVGISIDFKHLASTPEAAIVAIDASCVEVNKRRSIWSIVARDAVDEIGHARHERVIIRSTQFAESVIAKERILRAS
jgi:fluoroacetyl-CoA thioesterase